MLLELSREEVADAATGIAHHIEEITLLAHRTKDEASRARNTLMDKVERLQKLHDKLVGRLQS